MGILFLSIKNRFKTFRQIKGVLWTTIFGNFQTLYRQTIQKFQYFLIPVTIRAMDTPSSHDEASPNSYFVKIQVIQFPNWKRNCHHLLRICSSVSKKIAHYHATIVPVPSKIDAPAHSRVVFGFVCG